MKLKGINPFEQHVEKIVLGVLGVAALGVVASQFVFQSNKITVGKDKVSPEQAYEPVQRLAEELRTKVNNPPASLPTPPKTDVLDRFQKSLAGPVAPRPTLTDLGPKIVFGGGPGGGGPIGPMGDAKYAALAVPAPGLPVGRLYIGTVDPLEVIAAPEIKLVLPTEQPFDLFAVSVEMTFDGTALDKKLQEDPDGDDGPIQPIPRGWWFGSTEIVGVELERERLNENGEWSGTTPLGAIPGRMDLVTEILKQVKSPGDMPAMLEMARQRPRDVQRPDYYTLIAGAPWQPPSEVQDGLSPAEQIDAKQKRINLLDAELERLKKRQTASAEQGRTEERGGERAAGGGKGAAGGGGGGGGRGQAGGETRTTRPQPEGAKPVVSVLTQKINRAQAERDRLEVEMQTLREKLTNPGGAARTETALPVLRDPAVRLWAHDVKTEAGAVYRYRARVVVNNPFFGKEGSLTAEQKSLALDPLVRGGWSEFTDPITVVRKQYYYITGANDQNEIGGERATADLMKFYYGFFRRATISAQPGDMLIAEAKLPSELRIFDMQKLAAGARPKAEEPSRELAGRGEIAERGGRQVSAPVVPPEEGKGEQPKPEDELTKPAPQKLSMEFDAVLLDVAVPPAAKAGAKVFFREGLGTIVIRLPDQTSTDPIYKQLRDSARLGESQGRPVVKAREPRPDLLIRSPDAPTKRQDSHGGGGGDGGGGGGGG